MVHNQTKTLGELIRKTPNVSTFKNFDHASSWWSDPLALFLGLASTESSSKEVAPRSESSRESESLDSKIEELLRHFGRGYRTGGMSTPNIPDPHDDSWLKIPLSIPPLQAIAPDNEIVDIEDDSPEKVSEILRESEDVDESVADEEEDEVAKDDIAKEETIEASSSRAPVETGPDSSSQPPRNRWRIIPIDLDLIPDQGAMPQLAVLHKRKNPPTFSRVI